MLPAAITVFILLVVLAGFGFWIYTIHVRVADLESALGNAVQGGFRMGPGTGPGR